MQLLRTPLAGRDPKLNNTLTRGVTEMRDTYCLTALEAAEMVGIELSELLRIAASKTGIAIEVDGAWRVDLAALTQVLHQDDLRHAA